MSTDLLLPIISEVKQLLAHARSEVARAVNTQLLTTYWRIGEINKTQLLKLAEQGIELQSPKDINKDPNMFEFLDIPKNKPML